MHRFVPLALLFLAAPASADERSFMLSGFERIRVEGPFEVVVSSGNSASARAVGDVRAIDRVSVRVDGQTLVIAPGVNAWGGYPGDQKTPPQVTVVAARLRSASVVGGGKLTIDRMRGQRVDLSVTGSGSISVADAQADRIDGLLIGSGVLSVAGSAIQARFSTNGAGTIDAAALDAGALTVNAQSAGDASFSARNTADVSATGQGSIRVDGTATCTVRGSAPVVCGKAKRE